MVAIMDKRPNLAFLTPQLPPQGLQMPYRIDDDVVFCAAVGNTFKIVRREAYPIGEYDQKIGKYGDDGLVCSILEKKGYRTAFCRRIYCLHAGQCLNWGYKEEEILKDPRKSGYGKPFLYGVTDNETFMPVDLNLRI